MGSLSIALPQKLYADARAAGVICEDPRQFVPASGQEWTTLAELGERHRHTLLTDEEVVFPFKFQLFKLVR